MPDEATLRALFKQDYLREASAKPWSPTSVLSFFFAVNYNDDAQRAHGLRDGHSVLEMREVWFFGPSCFDELCEPFRDVIRAAGKAELAGPEWNSSVDGKVAQLILCDQLSRSAFRGSQEAFANDERSVSLARELSANLLSDEPAGAARLSGEFFSPYFVFLLTAFMHSERLDDHIQLSRVLDHSDAHSPAILHEWFGVMRKGSESHTRVVNRFGRYPHRNTALGRTNTEDEAAWLADVDNLPGWAKSQILRVAEQTG
jgi:uncharacterized protein (DUF924 family)